MQVKSATRKEQDNELVISFLTIRKGVGVLGVLLPVILAIGMAVLFNCNDLQPSISHYYYTRMGSYFTGTLCAVALFLFSYKGYDKDDKIACKLACFFALGVAFLPTEPTGALICTVMRDTPNSAWVGYTHFFCAGALFLTFAYISWFLFTKTDGRITEKKRQRNIIYRVCAVTMVICVALLVIYSTVESLQDQFRDYRPIFWLEALALWAFGWSWLTKGEFILGDKPKTA